MTEEKVEVVVSPKNRRRHLLATEREQIIAMWAKCGLTVKEFSQRAGVSPSSLWRWKQDLRPTSRARTVSPVLMEVPPPIGGLGSAEVMTRNGSVRLFASATPKWAAQLIRELNQC